MDLCAATDRPIAARGESIVAGTIPGGRCAVLRVVGHTDRLEPAARYLLGDWLPGSGEQARGLPLHCRRLTFFPEVPEHEAVADLVLPLSEVVGTGGAPPSRGPRPIASRSIVSRAAAPGDTDGGTRLSARGPP